MTSHRLLWLVAVVTTNALQLSLGSTQVRTAQQPWRLASAPVASLADDTAALSRFNAWLVSKGVIDESTRVRGERRDGWGMCLVADRDISTGEQLLQVPRTLHLSASAAKNSLLATVMDEVLAATGGDESGVLALYLLHECAIGDDSDFAPYLAVLPSADELDVPILWSGEERAKVHMHLFSILTQTRPLS